ncbi:MAG TPA: class I adenylate-forming enzyme family protein [Baekduia sp.]|uniref:class I adenylate-forming enzyme family protein n=1 Tax=Baekduia sp. TaxID=2600305 RepID=UPI002D77E77B|nr:class I adenylate-forming enzyme family protein [Baekduia sp.]HET6505494.1 class I adenylate-forming enzyme family protein [Baekduia sp.]
MSTAAFDVSAARAALEARHPEWVPRALHAALDDVAAAHPGRAAVLTDERAVTYAELAEWSARIARGLVAAGVEPGDRVAVVLPNAPAFAAVTHAISRVGAIGVPLNVRLQPRELAELLAQHEVAALLAVARFRDAGIAGALDGIAPGWEREGGGAALPALRRVVLVDDGDDAPGTRPEATRLGAFERDADPALDAELARRARAASPDDVATIFTTSGTTGHPRGAQLTHDMLLRSAYGSAYTRGFEDGRRILFALPLHHVFAYVEGMLAALLAAGAIVPRLAFEPVDTLEAIARHRAHEVLMVPTMSLAVVDAAASGAYDTSSLHAVMSAAAACPARLWAQLAETLGVSELVTGYGMTETSAATTFTLPGDPVQLLVETVGRPKLGGVAGDPALDGMLSSYRTIDPDTGAALPDGAVGELVATGPIVTRGYAGDAHGDAQAFDARGWLRSGDLGRVRPDGYLELTGRGKDTYKCGGEQVMPQEVEAILTELDAVEQAHVCGLPDERMGEIGCAFVVVADGADAPSEEALLIHCRDRLSRFKVPAHVLFVRADELPLTASGKVRRFVLVQRARATLGR